MTRRNRIPVALAAVFALAVLATSFPLSGLIAQRHQLSAAAAQLKAVQHSNQLLAEQESQLGTKVEIDRLARQEFQLVSPGQTLYDVLPPSGETTSLTPGASTSGDPGTKPLVDPADAPDMSPDPGLAKPLAPVGGSSRAPSGGVVTTTTAPAVPSTFWGRVSNTLEFWK